MTLASSFSVRRSLAWMAMSQACLFVVQFAGSVIIARLLSAYEMGIFAIAMAVTGLLSVVRVLGLVTYVVRAAQIDEATLACVFTINALLALAVSVLVAMASLLGGMLFQEDGVRQVLLVLAVMPLVSIFEFMPSAMLEREGNFRVISTLNLVRAAVSTTLIVWLAFLGFSYMSLAYGQLATAIFGTLLLNIVGRRHARIRIGLQGWRDVLRYGLQILAIAGVNLLSARLSEIALGRLLGLSALGLYSRASSLNSLLWDNVHLVIGRVVLVDFAEQRRKGMELRDSYLKIVRMVTALLWPAFGGMAIVSGPLVVTLYGEPWVGAALPLALLSLASFTLSIITMTWEVYVVSQQTARQARLEFIRAGIGFVLFILGCLASLAWAAAARLGEALFSLALYRRDLQRMTNTGMTDLIPIYLSSFGLALVALAPAFAVMAWHDWSPLAPLPQVLPAIALGVAAWSVAILVTDHPLAGEARRLMSQLRTLSRG